MSIYPALTWAFYLSMQAPAKEETKAKVVRPWKFSQAQSRLPTAAIKPATTATAVPKVPDVDASNQTTTATTTATTSATGMTTTTATTKQGVGAAKVVKAVERPKRRWKAVERETVALIQEEHQDAVEEEEEEERKEEEEDEEKEKEELNEGKGMEGQEKCSNDQASLNLSLESKDPNALNLGTNGDSEALKGTEGNFRRSSRKNAGNKRGSHDHHDADDEDDDDDEDDADGEDAQERISPREAKEQRQKEMAQLRRRHSKDFTFKSLKHFWDKVEKNSKET